MEKLFKMSMVIVVMTLLFTGCKKNEDEAVDATVVSGSWTLGSNTYKVAYSAKSTTSQGNTLLIFADGPLNVATINSVSLSFKTAPTTSGTYQLVSVSTAPTGTQFTLSAGNNTTAFAYILPATVNVEVTANAGKLKVVIPAITLKSATSGVADATFSATLQEM